MATKPRTTPDVAQAKKLLAAIRSGLRKADAALKEFIEIRGWKALGYESFGKFWANEMADIRIATELRPEIVFALYDEGILPDEVADIVRDVGDQLAETWKDEYDAGTPSNQASRRARSRPPVDPLPTETLFLHLPRGMMRQLRDVSASSEVSPEQMSIAVIQAFLRAQTAVA